MMKKRKRSQTKDLNDGRVELLDSDEDDAVIPLREQSIGDQSTPQPGTPARSVPVRETLFMSIDGQPDSSELLSADVDAIDGYGRRQGSSRYSCASLASSSVAVKLKLQKVTITTVHAAKGLEWPVVFIPAGQLFLSGLVKERTDWQSRAALFLRIGALSRTKSQKSAACSTWR